VQFGTTLGHKITGRAFLETVIVSQLVNKSAAFDGTWRFSLFFKSVHPFSLISHCNQVQILALCFFNIYINNILKHNPISSKCYLFFRDPTNPCIQFPSQPLSLSALSPRYPHNLKQCLKNAKIVKVLIMQFTLASYFFQPHSAEIYYIWSYETIGRTKILRLDDTKLM